MRKKKSSNRARGVPSTEGSGSTADRLAAMTDAELAAEYARMLVVVRQSEEKLAKMPRPFPPEMRGYAHPGFHLYLDRKYLNRVADEVIARERHRESSTEK